MLRNNVVTVDLGKIRQNYLLQKSLLPRETEIMPVVKADAYGHGMTQVATALHSMGAKHFAVALAEEGVELRESGISGEILVLGPAMEEAAEECVRHDLTQTVFTPEMVELLEKEAEKQERDALIHIKLDPGMGRIGLRTYQEAEALAEALDVPNVIVTGVTAGDRIGYRARFGAERMALDTPRVPGSFKGTGDVFASTLCGALLGGGDYPAALERAADFCARAVAATAERPGHWYGLAFEALLHT